MGLAGGSANPFITQSALNDGAPGNCNGKGDEQRQEKKQIPCGNDRKKGKGKGNGNGKGGSAGLGEVDAEGYAYVGGGGFGGGEGDAEAGGVLRELEGVGFAAQKADVEGFAGVLRAVAG